VGEKVLEELDGARGLASVVLDEKPDAGPPRPKLHPVPHLGAPDGSSVDASRALAAPGH
jgi:hypothetical protein